MSNPIFNPYAGGAGAKMLTPDVFIQPPVEPEISAGQYADELLNAIKANPDAFRGRGLMNWRSSDGKGIFDIPAEARAMGDAYLGSDQYRSTVTQPTSQAPQVGANMAPAPTSTDPLINPETGEPYPRIGDLVIRPDGSQFNAKTLEPIEKGTPPPKDSSVTLPDGSTVDLGFDYTDIGEDFIDNLPEINEQPTEPISETDFLNSAIVENAPFVPSGIDDISEISIDDPLNDPVGGFDSYEDYMTNLNNLRTEDFENYAEETGFQEGDTPQLGDLEITPEVSAEIIEKANNQPDWKDATVTLPDGRVVDLPTWQGEGSPFNEDGSWKTDLPEGFDIDNMEAPNPNVPQGVSNVGSIDPAVYDNVYQPSTVDSSIYEDAVFDQPILDMPEIIDYSEMMRAPLIDRVMGALDAPNPYDTRRDAMMRGPTSQIQRNWEQANEDLLNRFGVMGMDTPALAAQARKLDEAKALQMDNLESQWAGMAAGQDEGIRRNRLSDANQAMGSEYARVRDEMNYQGGLQDRANVGGQNFMAGAQAGMGDALSYDDTGLNMAVGAGGGYVAPNIGAATTGLGSVANQAGQNLKNQPDWSGASSNLYQAFNQPQQPPQQNVGSNPVYNNAQNYNPVDAFKSYNQGGKESDRVVYNPVTEQSEWRGKGRGTKASNAQNQMWQNVYRK